MKEEYALLKKVVRNNNPLSDLLEADYTIQGLINKHPDLVDKLLEGIKHWAQCPLDEIKEENFNNIKFSELAANNEEHFREWLVSEVKAMPVTVKAPRPRKEVKGKKDSKKGEPEKVAETEVEMETRTSNAGRISAQRFINFIANQNNHSDNNDAISNVLALQNPQVWNELYLRWVQHLFVIARNEIFGEPNQAA